MTELKHRRARAICSLAAFLLLFRAIDSLEAYSYCQLSALNNYRIQQFSSLVLRFDFSFCCSFAYFSVHFCMMMSRRRGENSEKSKTKLKNEIPRCKSKSKFQVVALVGHIEDWRNVPSIRSAGTSSEWAGARRVQFKRFIMDQ